MWNTQYPDPKWTDRNVTKPKHWANKYNMAYISVQIIDIDLNQSEKFLFNYEQRASHSINALHEKCENLKF